MVRLSAAQLARAGFPDRIYNGTNEVAPAGGIMEYYDMESHGRSLVGRKPVLDGISRIVLLPEAILPHEYGPCIGNVGAQCKILVPWTYAGGINIGDRAGSAQGSWWAVRDEMGPLRIDWIDPITEASPYLVSATITDDQAAPTIVALADGTVLGAFKTIIYCGARYASNPEPGEAVVF